jgi:hypothetical protein
MAEAHYFATVQRDRPDLAKGREVVPRFSVSRFRFPSGDPIGPITPTDLLFTPHEPPPRPLKGDLDVSV